MAERYSDARHGLAPWLDYIPSRVGSYPRQAGYYTVIVQRRRVWYVEKYYYFTGRYWYSRRGNKTTLVIKYDPLSYREELPND